MERYIERNQQELVMFPFNQLTGIWWSFHKLQVQLKLQQEFLQRHPQCSTRLLHPAAIHKQKS